MPHSQFNNREVMKKMKRKKKHGDNWTSTAVNLRDDQFGWTRKTINIFAINFLILSLLIVCRVFFTTQLNYVPWNAKDKRCEYISCVYYGVCVPLTREIERTFIDILEWKSKSIWFYEDSLCRALCQSHSQFTFKWNNEILMVHPVKNNQ